MKQFAFYTGCTTPVRLPAYEASVKAVLEKEGYTVVTATNADDALKKEATANPALILMDIMIMLNVPKITL